jgi:hypothetical protein
MWDEWWKFKMCSMYTKCPCALNTFPIKNVYFEW